MTKLELIQIGESVGIVLPEDVLARLKVEKGDSLYLTDVENGVKLTPYRGEFEAQMLAGRKVMKKWRKVLRALAK